MFQPSDFEGLLVNRKAALGGREQGIFMNVSV